MAGTDRHLSFERGLRPPIALLGFIAVLSIISALGRGAVIGPDPPNHVLTLWTAPFLLLVAIACWRTLRLEGVSLADVGLGRAAFGPGLTAFAALWGWVTVAGVGYLIATDATGALGFPFGLPWYWVLGWLLLQRLTVGLVEEAVCRGHLQNKFVAVLHDRGVSRYPRFSLGTVLAAVAFAIIHTPPWVLLGQLPVSAVPIAVLNLTLIGTLFGVMYLATQNVWYVGFVHGFANVWLLPFALESIPAFRLFVFGAAILLSIGYWYWGIRTDRIAVRIEPKVAGPDHPPEPTQNQDAEPRSSR